MQFLTKIRDAEISRNHLGTTFSVYYIAYVRSLLFRRMIVKRQYSKIGFSSTNIQTYGFCNRRCSFCFHHDRFEKTELGIMEESTWEKIIDDLASLKYCGRISPYLYGEPLLDKRLAEFIDYARKRCPHSYISIHTNGDFLDESFLKKLLLKGVDDLIVTNYDQVEKPDLTLLASKYPLHIYLRNLKDFKILNRAGGIFDRKSPKAVPCLRPSSQLVINWRGEVLLCCDDFYSKYIMGNIKGEKLLDIWNNEKFQSYRNDLRLGYRSRIEICKNCDDPGEIPW